jgi:hypothetical protein
MPLVPLLHHSIRHSDVLFADIDFSTELKPEFFPPVLALCTMDYVKPQ